MSLFIAKRVGKQYDQEMRWKSYHIWMCEVYLFLLRRITYLCCYALMYSTGRKQLLWLCHPDFDLSEHYNRCWYSQVQRTHTPARLLAFVYTYSFYASDKYIGWKKMYRSFLLQFFSLCSEIKWVSIWATATENKPNAENKHQTLIRYTPVYFKQKGATINRELCYVCFWIGQYALEEALLIREQCEIVEKRNCWRYNHERKILVCVNKTSFSVSRRGKMEIFVWNLIISLLKMFGLLNNYTVSSAMRK